MNIIEKIKFMIQSFKNRNVPQLDRGKSEESYRSSRSARQAFVEKNREGVTPYVSRRPQRNLQPLQLVQPERPKPRQSVSQTKYTGRYERRLAAQERAKSLAFRKKVTALVISGVLATGVTVAAIKSQIKNYGNMSIAEISKCLDTGDYNPDDLYKMTNSVYNQGLLEIKEILANATGMDDSANMFKLQAAEYNGSTLSPTQIKSPNQIFYYEAEVSYPEERNTFSRGLASVVNSTGKAQVGGLTSAELSTYIEQLEVLSESKVSISSKDSYRDEISVDDEHERKLIELSIAEDLHKDNNVQESEDGFEIGD